MASCELTDCCSPVLCSPPSPTHILPTFLFQWQNGHEYCPLCDSKEELCGVVRLDCVVYFMLFSRPVKADEQLKKERGKKIITTFDSYKEKKKKRMVEGKCSACLFSFLSPFSRLVACSVSFNSPTFLTFHIIKTKYPACSGRLGVCSCNTLATGVASRGKDIVFVSAFGSSSVSEFSYFILFSRQGGKLEVQKCRKNSNKKKHLTLLRKKIIMIIIMNERTRGHFRVKERCLDTLSDI